MKQKLKEKIIRRLGGVPVWRFGYFPYMRRDWDLRLLECQLKQSEFEPSILEVKYEVLTREGKQ